MPAYLFTCPINVAFKEFWRKTEGIRRERESEKEGNRKGVLVKVAIRHSSNRLLLITEHCHWQQDFYKVLVVRGIFSLYILTTSCPDHPPTHSSLTAHHEEHWTKQ